MSHLRDLFATGNIEAGPPRGYPGDIVAITHSGKKKTNHALGWMR